MDKAKKKQMKKITTWVLLAALVAGLTAMPLLAKAEAEADGPVATVHSGQVTTGSVSTTLRGGGTLKTEDVEDVNLPSGVKITEFLVKNGDTVTEGTPLAAVDKVSVMTAIMSVRETMDYLQEEIRGAKDEKISSTVSATAGGRIKKVYAAKGDNVQDVMLKHGALALLSLDGLMAVEIETQTDLSFGEIVKVSIPNAVAVAGRVESNLDGVVTITLEDNNYAIGEKVTVTTGDGEEVGEGELYVHNAWAATAFSGTIQTVNAKEENKVSSGATLFTLTDTDFQATLEYMSSLHREYEDLMRDLFRMYNSGTIDAPCDGLISGIEKDSAHLLAAEDAAARQADQMAYSPAEEEQGWTLVLLSGTPGEPMPASSVECDPEAADCQATTHDPNCIKACTSAGDPADCNANKHYKNCIHSCSGGSSCTAEGAHKLECIESCVPKDGFCAKDVGYHKYACIKSCTHAASLDDCGKEGPPKYPHYPDCVKTCIQSDGSKDCPATRHLTSCIEACDKADDLLKCDATRHHYPDCIKLCIDSDSGSKTCPASKHIGTCFFNDMKYRAKVALVSQVAPASGELIVLWDASDKEYEVEKIGAGWKFKSDQGFNLDLLVNAGKIPVSNPSAYKPGDVVFVVTGSKGKTDVWTGIPVFMHISGMEKPNLDLSGLLAGMMPDFSGLLSGFNFNFGFYAPSPVEEDKLFDLEGSTLMTVSPEKEVSLVITLDEQDIARITEGQKALVKVEALGDQTFIAQVTEVSTRGVNSGGSSKFAVKLEMKKEKNMLDGMSATASLSMLTREDVPTIPVMALAEDGPWTVVYTALDEKTGDPVNPVPVTVGISDGKTAEILSGLEIGDTYYYSYYDVVEEDTGVEDRFTLR